MLLKFSSSLETKERNQDSDAMILFDLFIFVQLQVIFRKCFENSNGHASNIQIYSNEILVMFVKLKQCCLCHIFMEKFSVS